MNTFADLVASRKAWLAEVLQPWCLAAAQKDLRLAELEWVDIAGKVDPHKTLWFWAWSRFPDLVHAELAGIDETRRVTVALPDRAFSYFDPQDRQWRADPGAYSVMVGRSCEAIELTGQVTLPR